MKWEGTALISHKRCVSLMLVKRLSKENRSGLEQIGEKEVEKNSFLSQQQGSLFRSLTCKKVCRLSGRYHRRARQQYDH